MQLAALLVATLVAFSPLSRTNAGILAVEQFGKLAAQSVIFIPGLACGPWVWHAQIASLSPQYNVFVVTLPGFDGRKMVGGDDLMRRAVDSLHLLIVSHHLQRPIIVGHSLGGTRASIVTVEGGFPEAPTQAQRDARVAQSIAPYEGIEQRQLGAALQKNMLQYTITRKADVDRATQLAGRSEPAAVVAWMRAALSLDLTSKLSAIQVPFTVIIPFDARIDPYQGFKTASQKSATYRRWAAHARDSKVIIIEGARHFVMIDRPQEFEKALESAIAR